jgi:hypothetical protein
MTTTTAGAEGTARRDRASPRQRRGLLLYTRQGAELLGLSPAHFRELMDRQGIEPEATCPNPHRASGPDCLLWPPEAVRALAGGPEVAALQARRKAAHDAKARKADTRREALEARFPDWRDALAPAAEAMFSLNRYAKHGTCLRSHRAAIYALKNRLVRALHELGKATEVIHHFVYGSKYVAFRFTVEGRAYSWHQPRHLVDWPYEVTARGSAWEPDDEEKPVPLAARMFADAKALIAWVVGRHEAARMQTHPPS